MNDLFLENDKIHRMKSRAVEKYKVQHVNTERLKNSSKIAMQKMLNHDARIKVNARKIVILQQQW